MIDSGGHKVKSRSLTGPSARFGMTRLIFEWFLSQRWKRCATQRLYAALKRRSSTVVLAAVVVLLVRRRGQKQIRVKGDGRGCPSHTGWPRGLKPGFFFSDPNRHEWNSCPSRFLEGWVRCGRGRKSTAGSFCLAALARRKDKGWWWGWGCSQRWKPRTRRL